MNIFRLKKRNQMKCYIKTDLVALSLFVYALCARVYLFRDIPTSYYFVLNGLINNKNKKNYVIVLLLLPRVVVVVAAAAVVQSNLFCVCNVQLRYSASREHFKSTRDLRTFWTYFQFDLAISILKKWLKNCFLCFSIKIGRRKKKNKKPKVNWDHPVLLDFYLILLHSR